MEAFDDRHALIEDRLTEVIDAVDPDDRNEEMTHVVLSGGKRLRPLLTLLVCEAAGGDPEDAVDFAVGIELVHNASLVVDDIIDRSELRRGNNSAWAGFGHGPAIATSDGLLGEAFELFLADPTATEIVAQAMVALGEGEASEVTDQPVTLAEYQTLAQRKTGALFRAAAELGALAADTAPETRQSFGEYAEQLGIAFQMRDDILDVKGATETLGKPAGHDTAVNRPSVVHNTELSVTKAEEKARDHVENALAALAEIETPGAEAHKHLQELAEFVVTRHR